MAYIKKYTKPYPEWHNKPVKDTPITAEVMEGIDDAIQSIEAQLEKTTEMYADSPPMITMGNTDKTLKPFSSMVAGDNNTVSAVQSTACGYGNTVSGSSDIVGGRNNSVDTVHYSIVSGSENTVKNNATNDIVVGNKNTVSGVHYSSVVGTENKLESSGGGNHDIRGSYNEIASANSGNVSLEGTHNKNIEGNYYTHKVIGQYNDYAEEAESGAYIIFEAGNGSGESARSNAMYLDAQGNMRIGGDLIFGSSKRKLKDALNSTIIFSEHGEAQYMLSSAANTKYTAGQTLRIKKEGQADLWISTVHSESVSYSYTGDLEGDIVAAGGALQIGYYSVALVKAEKQTVDLTDYAKKTDIPSAVPVATAEVAGKVRPDGVTITVDENGIISAVSGGGEININNIWYPTVSESGELSWEKSTSQEAPVPVNIKGSPGADGTPGADGAAGKSAYEAAVENGFSGTETEWLASLKGSDGSSGTDGKSAYELAVEDGYSGTQEEWLSSLKGADGAPGTAGQPGNDGSPGQDGVSPQVSISKEGTVTTITITDASGTHTAAINDGEKGADGETYSEADKQELMTYIDTKFTELTGDILGGAS